MSETVDNHNAPRWLVVRWLEARRVSGGRGQGRRAGWYVVRVCPCHWGEEVTVCYTDKLRAEQARRLILGEVVVS